MKLARYIEGGIEPVLEASLRRFFDVTLATDWRELPEMKKLLRTPSATTERPPASDTTSSPRSLSTRPRRRRSTPRSLTPRSAPSATTVSTIRRLPRTYYRFCRC